MFTSDKAFNLKKMENLEKRILVLSKWLKECTIYNDSDGVLKMSDKEIEFELKIKFD